VKNAYKNGEGGRVSRRKKRWKCSVYLGVVGCGKGN